MRIIATLLAALLLFSACADDPEPKEPKKSSTPKPTATVPTLPPEAKAKPPEGAAAFVSYFIAVFNHAARTGETSQLLKISTGCAPCGKYAQDFEDGFKRGERLSDDLWHLENSEVVPNDNGIDVIASIQGQEQGKTVTYDLGFTLPPKPPYAVKDIFEAVPR